VEGVPSMTAHRNGIALIKGTKKFIIKVASDNISSTVTPNTLSNLTATLSTDKSHVRLHWDQTNSPYFKHYQIYRKDLFEGSSFKKIGFVTNRSFSQYEDTTIKIKEGHKYAYSVTLVYRNEKESALSNEITVIIPIEKPGSISEIIAYIKKENAIQLEWLPAIKATAYAIYKKQPGIDKGELIATTAALTYTEHDIGNNLIEDSEYHYCVKPYRLISSNIGIQSPIVKALYYSSKFKEENSITQFNFLTNNIQYDIYDKNKGYKGHIDINTISSEFDEGIQYNTHYFGDGENESKIYFSNVINGKIHTKIRYSTLVPID
jgi:hypothetical protein